MRYVTKAAAAAFITVLAAPVNALEVGLTVFEESEYTNNLTRATSEEISDWTHSPGATVTANHAGPDLDLEVDYTLVRRIYGKDVYDDSNEAVGTASLVWDALPERLTFTADHHRTQTAVRADEAVTPDNLVETSDTSLGPTLLFNPRGSDLILIQHLWGKRTSEESVNDAETNTSTISYVMPASPNTTVTLAAINSEVDYDGSNFADITYERAQLTWEQLSETTTVSLMGGYNVTDRDQQSEDADGFIYRADVSWQSGANTSFGLNASRDFLDRSTSLSQGSFADELDVPTGSDLNEVFINERYSAKVTGTLGGATTIDASITYDSEDYVDIIKDTDRMVYTVDLARQLNPKIRFSLGFSYIKEDFTEVDEDAETFAGDIQLTYQAGKKLSFDFGGRYYGREDELLLESRPKINEWSVYARVAYNILPR